MTEQLDAPAPIAQVDLSGLDLGLLEAMRAAGREVLSCQRALAKTGDSILGDLLRHGPQDAAPFDHYPVEDVFDPEFHAQYYYHRHPPAQGWPGEHGHFHLFMRGLGWPEDAAPIMAEGEDLPDPDDRVSHVIALALDEAGLPSRLFATNRWVTSEIWLPADDVVRMADLFCVDHAWPSWPLNRWVTGMVRLFQPQIEALVTERDRALARLTADRSLSAVFNDRTVEVLSWMPIDLDHQIGAVDRAWRRQRRAAAASAASGA